MNTSSPSQEEISRRATEIWNARGQPSGSDVDIWLEAERQLTGDPGRAKEGPPSTERAPLAERVKDETAAESVIEYQMSPAPSKERAIKAAVETQNAKPSREPDHTARPGSSKAAPAKTGRSASGKKGR